MGKQLLAMPRQWAALLLVAAMSVPAYADTVTLNTGEYVIFNYEFTSQPHQSPPPYAYGEFEIEFLDFNPGDSVLYAVFGGLGATGPVVYEGSTSNPFNGELFFEFATNNCCGEPSLADPLLDGQFSVLISATAGPFDVRADRSTFVGSEGLTHFLPRAVPEPGSLALLGVGLAGLGFSRRKH